MNPTVKPLLEGIRILDLSRILAGPYCTMVLGDLGADVIKIELPGKGDDTRQWGPPFTEDGDSAYYLSVNRNKKSVTLNLKSPRGQKILQELIRKSDVLIENFRAGTMEEWGLDYENLQRIKPGLVYCTITGFGYSGPYKERPGYDFIIQALGGLMSITGPVQGPPTKVGVAVVDIFAGLFAANAIQAALLSRALHGDGHRIDISLLDCAVAILANQASNYLVSGHPPPRHGNAHPNIVPYEIFQASDGYFAMGIGNDSQWQRFCQSVGRTEWLEDSRFLTNEDRVRHRAILIEWLNQWFSADTVEKWLDELLAAGIPAAPVNRVDEVFEDPQVRARGMRVGIPRGQDEKIPQVASPLNIPTAPPQYRYPPPKLGENTEEVLGKLAGIDSDEMRELRDQQVI